MVFAEAGNAINLEDVDGDAFWRELLGRPQSRTVIRLTPKTAGDTEDVDRFVHSLVFVKPLIFLFFVSPSPFQRGHHRLAAGFDWGGGAEVKQIPFDLHDSGLGLTCPVREQRH